MVTPRSPVTVDSYLDDYIWWLMEMTSAPIGYKPLFDILQEIEFYWSNKTKELSMDKNRSNDGLQLRHEFMEERIPSTLRVKFRDGRDISMRDYFNGMLFEDCTVLEMMVALARRMKHHVSERDIDIIFMDMLCNLGLDDQDTWDKYEVYDTIEFMMDRKYGKTGKGSMFPCNRRGFNLNEMEIWRQANLYCQREDGVFE